MFLQFQQSVQITATPEAILALAIFADAPLDDVIVVGCGLIPVASSKKSIVVKTTWSIYICSSLISTIKYYLTVTLINIL